MSATFYILGDEARVILIQKLEERGLVCLSNQKVIAIFDSDKNSMTTLHFADDAPVDLMGCVCFFYDYNLNFLNRKEISKLACQVEQIMFNIGIRTYCD